MTMEQYCLTPSEDLILLTFIDSNLHFPKHLANWRNEMQLRLEDEDAALEEREGKGKLQAEFLFISEMAIQWHCCRVFFKHIEDKYELSLLTCTTKLCKFCGLWHLLNKGTACPWHSPNRTALTLSLSLCRCPSHTVTSLGDTSAIL